MFDGGARRHCQWGRASCLQGREGRIIARPKIGRGGGRGPLPATSKHPVPPAFSELAAGVGFALPVVAIGGEKPARGASKGWVGAVWGRGPGPRSAVFTSSKRGRALALGLDSKGGRRSAGMSNYMGNRGWRSGRLGRPQPNCVAGETF